MAETEFTRPPFDATAAQRWQGLLAASASDAGAPWLHEEVGRRMAERLTWIKRQPAQWINWRASASGPVVHGAVCSQYPKSKVFLAPSGYESARSAQLLIAKNGFLSALTHRFLGQTASMLRPVADGSADLLWANMSLHTEPDPAACVKAWHRMLAVDGMLMFSCLGPDTAIELRPIYAANGWGPSAHPLTDMHDWGDLLVGSGFSEPVMDMERVVLSFATAKRALQELRGLGRNLHPERFSGLRGRKWHERLLAALEERAGSSGEITLTFEVIYGHAIKQAPRVNINAESAIALDDMRAMLRRQRQPLKP